MAKRFSRFPGVFEGEGQPMPAVNERPPVSQAELAAIFGVTPQTIKAWERKGCPVERMGGRGVASLYRPADVIRWREAQAAMAATGDLAAMDMEEAKRRKLAAEAAIAELDLEKRRGTLIEVAVSERETAALLVGIRTRMLSVGSKSAPRLQLAGSLSDYQSIVDQAVTEALDEISSAPYDFLDRGDDEDDVPGSASTAGGGDDEAAAAADPKRVV